MHLLLTSSFDGAPFIYGMGIAGIIISILLIILALIMYLTKVTINKYFGYRTKLSFSSNESWTWCNDTFSKLIFIFGPITLIAHIIIFTLTIIYDWFFIWTIFTFIISIIYLIPLIIFIEIKGRKKFAVKK